MIQVGDLVQGKFFHFKIGLVIKVDVDTDFVFVQFGADHRCWEPIASLVKVSL